MAEFKRTGPTPVDTFTNHQVGESGQQVQPIVVYRQASVAHLAIAKDLLDVPERVFHFSPDVGFNLLGLQLIRIQLLASARTFGNEPGHIFTMLMLRPFFVYPGNRHRRTLPLFTVQQLVGGYDVVDVGGRGVDAVNQPECVVDTNVHLHAKAPLVALLGLVHFWITLAALILGGARY